VGSAGWVGGEGGCRGWAGGGCAGGVAGTKGRYRPGQQDHPVVVFR